MKCVNQGYRWIYGFSGIVNGGDKIRKDVWTFPKYKWLSLKPLELCLQSIINGNGQFRLSKIICHLQI